MKLFDILAHILLLLGFGLGVLAILVLDFDSTSRLAVVVLFAFFYILWGVIYHMLRRDITRRIFFEYLILSAMAVVVGILVFGI